MKNYTKPLVVAMIPLYVRAVFQTAPYMNSVSPESLLKIIVAIFITICLLVV